MACLDIARPYEDAPLHGTASDDDLDSLATELTSLGVRALTVQADVSDEDAVEAAVARVSEDLGTATLVANVAGGSGPDSASARCSTSGSPSSAACSTSTWSAPGWSRACATRMVADGVGGRICNVSSQAGKRGFPFLGPYCAAKAGVILMTQTMALELGPAGIAVNAVCPGTVDTDLMNKDSMFENLMGGPEGLAAYIAREIPLGRLQSSRRRSPAPSVGCSPSRRPGSPVRR